MTREAFLQQFELFRHAGPDADIRPLVKAALAHAKSGTLVMSDFGPLFGVLWFNAQTRPRFWRSLVTFNAIRFYRLLTASRGLWNDFHMCLWMLSQSQAATNELYDHVTVAIRKRRALQVASAQWMISSVCEQEPELKRQWNLATAQHGEVFG